MNSYLNKDIQGGEPNIIQMLLPNSQVPNTKYQMPNI